MEFKGIINTHSHADHIGGNQLLQNRLNCEIFSANIENTFIKNTILESSFLFGGYPCEGMRNKFLMAQPSESNNIEMAELPEGMEYINLEGHSYGMIGVKTPDDVYFLGDGLVSEKIINKYHISVIYDVKAYLETLEKIKDLDGKVFIPSHADAMDDIKSVVEINRNKIVEIINLLLEICNNPSCFEDILKQIFDHYFLKMDLNQYILVGSTIKSYLSYLYDEDKLTVQFVDNKVLWKTV